MTRILIVEDHPIVQRALSDMIAMAAAGIETVCSADLRDALRRLGPTRPRVDLAVVDLHLPDARNATVIDALRARAPALPLVVFSAAVEPTIEAHAMAAGALAVLGKDTAPAVLHATILKALDAAGARGPSAGAPATPAPPAEAPAPNGRVRLTLRERDVLRLLVAGRRNLEIGRHLGLAPGTVRAHVSNVLLKMGARNRVEAVIAADRVDPPL